MYPDSGDDSGNGAARRSVIVAEVPAKHGAALGLQGILVLAAGAFIAAPRLISGDGFDTITAAAMIVVLAGGFFTIFWFRNPDRDKAAGPTRITIDSDRITLTDSRGSGSEWTKSDGDLVRVKGNGRNPQLCVGDPALETAALPMRYFDLVAVRAACVEHGWSWQERNGPVLRPVPETVRAYYRDPSAPPLTEARPPEPVLIRKGHPRYPAASTGAMAGLVLLAAVMCAGSPALELIFDDAGPAVIWLGPLIAVVPLVLLVGLLLWFTSRLRVSVAIDPEQVTVRYGGSTSVVQRHAVESVVITGERADFHPKTGRRRLLILKCQGHAAECRERLAAAGWPLN